MDMEIIAERIAKLEVKQEAAQSERDAIRQETKEISATLDRMENELTRYRGFWGGIVLVITAVLTFFKFYADNIASFFKGTG